jgi:hypothetical protein
MVILGNTKSRQNQFGGFGCETYRRADERTDKRDFRIKVYSKHFMQKPKYPKGARSVSKVFDIKQETEITYREPSLVFYEISDTAMTATLHHHTCDLGERGGEACDDDFTSTHVETRIPCTYETLRYEFVLQAHKTEEFV